MATIAIIKLITPSPYPIRNPQVLLDLSFANSFISVSTLLTFCETSTNCDSKVLTFSCRLLTEPVAVLAELSINVSLCSVLSS